MPGVFYAEQNLYALVYMYPLENFLSNVFLFYDKILFLLILKKNNSRLEFQNIVLFFFYCSNGNWNRTSLC